MSLDSVVLVVALVGWGILIVKLCGEHNAKLSRDRKRIKGFRPHCR